MTLRRRTLISVLAAATLPAAVAAPAQAGSVEGKWRGTVHLVGGSTSFPLVMTIKSTVVGKRSGTIVIPKSPCRGKITLKGRKGPKFLFQYRENADTGCTGDDRVTVSVVDGKLNWKGVAPDGTVGKGRLSRV